MFALLLAIIGLMMLSRSLIQKLWSYMTNATVHFNEIFLGITPSEHPKRTLDPNTELRMKEIVEIFHPSCTCVWGCHIGCVQVSVITKQAQGLVKQAILQLLVKTHPLKS